MVPLGASALTQLGELELERKEGKAEGTPLHPKEEHTLCLCLYVCVCVCVSVCLSAYLPVCLPACLSVYPSGPTALLFL